MNHPIIQTPPFSRENRLIIVFQALKHHIYLQEDNVLYTRNVTICRLDLYFVIKIADFGLSEDVYAKNYFRQGQGSSVKLPVKWMAPESLQDGLFSDKTDVVSMQLFKGGSLGEV